MQHRHSGLILSFCQENTKMMKIVSLLALVVMASGAPEKRGLFDTLMNAGVTGIAQFGNFVLPKESMRAGCESVGLYNTNKAKQESQGMTDVAAGAVGSGLAQFGGAIFSRDSMKSGCISTGYYTENPQDQVQIQGMPPIIIYDPPVVVGGNQGWGQPQQGWGQG